jgi:hypothetical protein
MVEALQSVKGIDDDERALIAWQLCATPAKRLERNWEFLRSFGLFDPSRRKVLGFNS